METPMSEKLWRVQGKNPLMSIEWHPLFWRFGENESVPYEVLRKQLNRANAPVPVRIVRNSDSNRN